MDERRRVKRLEEENEVTITISSDEEKNPKEIIVLGQSKDISVLGTKIQVNLYLSVNTPLKDRF
jgi:hypothetical protein